ncbi:nucleotide exchange factor GrpE [Leucobacter sp. OH1287]|uniref:nucleotide exchange factor GrpE n=1 Tax=Leucobacter sp. OH1287 TaxID=2491049 RepID=UPI000F5FACA8|nr:nucleotide exchange factor GrpE [Leucobacter sp. OH1287]RRD61163.1 nucleotide exchange factor GrpE [Leucobacter sp. OH1287]
MTKEEQNANNEQVPHSGEPEANVSGSAAAAEPLTVEDILSAAQSEEAAAAENTAAADDAAPGGSATAGTGEGEAEAADGAAPGGSAHPDPLQDAANPYLEDLRRITAEYANYRKRTAETAELERQRAVAKVVTPLLAVLDDLDRAAAHGDLVEGTAFAAIAQKLRGSLEKLGLEAYGEAGEEFDPQLHEAIAQVPVPGTEQATVLDVVERGYKLGEVELRPAKVAVAVAADG